MKKYGGVSAELAAVDGRKRLNMDKVMTAVCFILLLIIVVIPIFMIVYNAFFYQGKLEVNITGVTIAFGGRSFTFTGDLSYNQNSDEHGYTEMFQQGKDNPPYERKRPTADLYTTICTSYQKTIKQLNNRD